MEDNHKPEPNSVDKQHNTTTTDDNETTQHQPSPYHPENLSTRDRQEPPKVDDNASAETANDLPIINRRRPSEAETKLVREYGGKENLREKTKLAYNGMFVFSPLDPSTFYRKRTRGNRNQKKK